MANVAVFDFDNTLINGDSFVPYLRYAAGTVRTYAAIAEALAAYGLARLRRKPVESLRTFMKGYMLRRLLKGKALEDLDEAAFRTREWQEINESVLQTLMEHQAKGDIIVIASGSLDLYMPELLKDFPYDVLICTEIGVENGIVTGEMIHGNCVRLGKAARIEDWLKRNGPFEQSFGYGNYPHDVPMLNLVKHRIIVS